MNIIAQKQSNSIFLFVTPAPDWDDFIDWGQALLQQQLSRQAATIDSGADRHMLGFDFKTLRFSLNYENYSDSIWIESQEPAAQEQLDELFTLIQQPGNAP